MPSWPEWRNNQRGQNHTLNQRPYEKKKLPPNLEKKKTGFKGRMRWREINPRNSVQVETVLTVVILCWERSHIPYRLSTFESMIFPAFPSWDMLVQGRVFLLTNGGCSCHKAHSYFRCQKRWDWDTQWTAKKIRQKRCGPKSWGNILTHRQDARNNCVTHVETNSCRNHSCNEYLRNSHISFLTLCSMHIGLTQQMLFVRFLRWEEKDVIEVSLDHNYYSVLKCG